jgi:hypothetical protein
MPAKTATARTRETARKPFKCGTGNQQPGFFGEVTMRRFRTAVWFLCAALLTWELLAAAPPRPPSQSIFPDSISGWRTDGKAESYDRETVYKYMDGGAEVYLEYGMKSLLVQKYTKKGEPPIVFDLFEMDSPEGAFGAFTFEREDAEAGIGQGSEYGGGLLRFWRGRTFGFIQAERETPAARDAILALGKAVAEKLGPDRPNPSLPTSLSAEDLRPLSIRFFRSPLLLEVLEPALANNPLGLPARCEGVLGRFGPKGNRERVVLARYPDAKAAEAGVEALLRSWTKASASPSEPFLRGGAWTVLGGSGTSVVLVLDASDAAGARRRLDQVRRQIEGGKP